LRDGQFLRRAARRASGALGVGYIRHDDPHAAGEGAAEPVPEGRRDLRNARARATSQSRGAAGEGNMGGRPAVRHATLSPACLFAAGGGVLGRGWCHNARRAPLCAWREHAHLTVRVCRAVSRSARRIIHKGETVHRPRLFFSGLPHPPCPAHAERRKAHVAQRCGRVTSSTSSTREWSRSEPPTLTSL
jgi:hypothetical protein